MLFPTILPTETVENPCKDYWSYPGQCFIEVFKSIPETALISLTFAGAAAVWVAILAATLFAVYYAFRHIYKALVYVCNDTKMGNVICFFRIPERFRFCSKAPEAHTAKSTESITVVGSIGKTIAKLQPDIKWAKVFRSVHAFGKGNHSVESANDQQSDDQHDPPASPTSKRPLISLSTPKILSPKAITSKTPKSSSKSK